MVCTRRNGSVGTERVPALGEGSEAHAEGSIHWFTVDQGLNGCGVIPGTTLGNQQCSRADYVAFWGEKNYHNGGRYRRRVSPRMVRRIRHHYQRCFLRPVGSADAIPYHFGRGLLAERNGHAVNWAAYARKMTHRGTGDRAHLGESGPQSGELRRNGQPFQFISMEELRKRTNPSDWPKNEAASETDDEEGHDSDWEVNVQFKPDEEDGGKLVRVSVDSGHLRARASTSPTPTSAVTSRAYREDGNPEMEKDEVGEKKGRKYTLYCTCANKRPRTVPDGVKMEQENASFADTDQGPHVYHQEFSVKAETVEADVRGPVIDGRVPGGDHVSHGTPTEDTLSSDGLQDISGRSRMEPMTEAEWKMKYISDRRLVPNHSETKGKGKGLVAGEAGAKPMALTFEACQEYVNLKIRRGRLALNDKARNLGEMLVEFKLDMAAYGMQELRVKRFRKEYELSVAVREHIGATKGKRAIDESIAGDIAVAFGRKEAAEKQLVNEQARAKESGDEVRRAKGELETLEKFVAVWAKDPEDHAEALFQHLQREDIDEETAFQYAGLACRCSNVDCPFPFDIDDLHRHL